MRKDMLDQGVTKYHFKWGPMEKQTHKDNHKYME